MRRIPQFGVLLLALIAATGARAIPLSDLLAGATLTAGDKVFDQFTLIQFISTDVTRELDAASIDVTALDDGGNNPGPGLLFTASNGALAVTGDGGYSFIDFAFGFRVTAAPGLGVSGNRLTLAADLSTTASPFEDLGATILEWIDTALVLDPSTPGYIQTTSNNLAGVAQDVLTASSQFGAMNQVYVTKDILVWATSASETATLTSFEQRFAQSLVPEPGSLALLATALVAIGTARRRGRG